MNDETLKALKGSIRKWEKVLDGTGPEQGAINCPLCQMFLKGKNDMDGCVGCPVMKSTGVQFCELTPYSDYIDAEEAFDDEGMKKAAQAELDFLKSLLTL